MVLDYYVNSLALVVYLAVLSSIEAGYLDTAVPISPCPEIFSYRKDLRTERIFGKLEIPNLQVGQPAKLKLVMSIVRQLNWNNLGSINQVKSLSATSGDIARGKPAQYRVNFPLPYPLPTVLSIQLNGNTICTGQRHQGISTVIKLEKVLNTGLQSEARNPAHLHRQLETKFISSPDGDCGKPSSSFLSRLAINGELAYKGQFPWIVPLFDRDHPRNPKYMCGSTIISRKHIITAAHCVYEAEGFIEPSRVLAIPGMFNTDNFFDENAQLSDVEQIIPHEEYVHDDDLNDADIALLRLKTTLELSDYIGPVCLWDGGSDLKDIVGQEGILAGWGIREQGTSSVPTFMRTIVVDKRQCSLNLLQMSLGSARVFCGDGRGATPCNGDSGSGMILKKDSRFFLRGVVSKGMVDHETLKCDATKYALYTDIAPFLDWIRSAMTH
ncbi:serine protease gd-like isoform X2 [Toxorhynchites rutilus septentrionalis]|nr:serine protease gd-like isoform X2 [Toxorhynchites rutilus septentrionalis]XP_055641652.1 serine protease gd-like isoform X2 [Toxorhynchites rutilus septentrionalis]